MRLCLRRREFIAGLGGRRGLAVCGHIVLSTASARRCPGYSLLRGAGLGGLATNEHGAGAPEKE
jgi:hypothetical protein